MPVQTLGTIAQILANTIWGISVVVVKIALSSMSPYTFVFLRLLLTVIILTPFVLPRLLKTKIKPRDYLFVFLSGFFGITLNIGLFFLGLKNTTAIDSSVIAATTSLFTALAAYLFLKEKISRIMLLGMLISFFGVVAIIIQPILENGLFRINNLLGNVFILGATWAWVGYTILGKEINRKYDSWVLSYYAFTTGAICFLPFSLGDITNLNFYLRMNSFGWFAIVFEAVFPTIIAYFLFSWSLKFVSATKAAVIAYLHPIVAIVSSILFLREKPTIPFLFGTFLIIFGLFLSEAKHKKHPLHHLHKK